MQVVKFYSLV